MTHAETLLLVQDEQGQVAAVRRWKDAVVLMRQRRPVRRRRRAAIPSAGTRHKRLSRPTLTGKPPDAPGRSGKCCSASTVVDRAGPPAVPRRRRGRRAQGHFGFDPRRRRPAGLWPGPVHILQHFLNGTGLIRRFPSKPKVASNSCKGRRGIITKALGHLAVGVHFTRSAAIFSALAGPFPRPAVQPHRPGGPGALRALGPP